MSCDPEPQPVKARIQIRHNHSKGGTDTLLLILQEKCQQGTWTFCSDLLSVLVDSADWLLIFKPSGTYIFNHTREFRREDIITHKKCTFGAAQMVIWLQ